MIKEIETFYGFLKDFYSEIVRLRTKTISTRDFKDKAIDTYEAWKTKIQPMLSDEVEEDVLFHLNHLFERIYEEARMRVAEVSHVKALIDEINDVFFKEVVVPLRNIEFYEPKHSLIDSASFLGLDTNWSLSTCALQLQEVAVTLVAKRKGIKLNKKSVEKILSKKIQNLTFNDRYEAFVRCVKDSFNVELPILTTHLRRMRTMVLHEGYNPKPEETSSIVSFTIGLLQKLRVIDEASSSF